MLLFAGDTADERILLMLNNNRAESMTASLKVYTARGVETLLPDVVMAPQESKLLELSPLILAAGLGNQKLGWLKVNYNGVVQQMGAQLTTYPIGDGPGVDSARSLDIDFASTERDAAFWIPEHGRARLALTNQLSGSIFVKLKCASIYEEFTIPAKMTRVKRFSLDDLEFPFHRGRVPVSCEVSYTGAISALRAAGTIVAPGYSAPVRFYDPKTATFQSLTAVGLQVAGESHVVVHNVTDSPVAFIPILREAALKEPFELSLPLRTLAAHGTAEVDFSTILAQFQRKDINRGTLTLKTDSPKGALVGAVTQIGVDGLIEDIPLKTSNPAAFAMGSYPLRWSGDYTNLVTVANTSEKALQIGGIVTAGDMVYVFKREFIEPGSTIVLDIDKWKREHTPDVNGKVIPSDATYGKIHWIEMGLGKNAGLLGRQSLASVQDHRRSSFSCPGPCGFTDLNWPNFFDGSIFTDLAFGQTLTTTAYQYIIPSNGAPYYYPYNVSPFGNNFYITSSSSNIVSFNYSGGPYGADVTETGTAPGSTNLEYIWYDDYVEYDPNFTECHEYPSQQPQDGVSSVGPTITYTDQTTMLNGTVQTVVVGQKISLTAQFTPPSGVTVSSQSWSVPGTTIGGFTASLNSGTTTATTFNQPSTTFYWEDPGNYRFVMYTVNLSDGTSLTSTVTFNVSGPVGGTISVDGPIAPVIFNSESPPKVRLGNGTTVPGIVFTASATSGDSGGQYSFVQKILTHAVTRVDMFQTCDETTGVGLDTQYPYATGSVTNDNPATGFFATDQEITTSNTFTMYLMWQPSIALSIPVPIGYINWGWYADVVQTAPTSSIWVMNNTPASSASSFVSSLAYPQWTTHGSSGPQTCVRR